jgi:hypothetical protein
MAARKNTAVTLNYLSENNQMAIGAGPETYFLDLELFKVMLYELQGLDLLICEFSKVLDQKGVNPQTATAAQLKLELEGNYKI